MIYWLLLLGFVGAVQALELEKIPIWEDRDSVDIPYNEEIVADTSSLITSGYKSMEIVVGEDGVDVRQGLRLGVVGEVSPGWYLDVRLVDEGLEQGELRVTTLAQVDEIFIQLLHEGYRLRIGDYLTMEDSLFSLYSYLPHRSQGVSIDYQSETRMGFVAVGQDQVHKQSHTFYIQPGQRKGYLIGGNRYVTMVAGAEKVWLDGKILIPDVDYQIQSIGGILDFSDSLLVLPGSEVCIDYESFSEGDSRFFTQALGSVVWGSWMISAMGRSILGGGQSFWGSSRLRFQNSQRDFQSEFLGHGFLDSSDATTATGLAIKLDWKEFFNQGALEGHVVWEDSTSAAQRISRGESPLWSDLALSQDWALQSKDSLAHERSSWFANGRWKNWFLGSGVFVEEKAWRASKMQMGWQTEDRLLQWIWLRAEESQGLQSDAMWRSQHGSWRPFWNGAVRRMTQADSVEWEALSAAGVELSNAPYLDGKWQATVNRIQNHGEDSLFNMDVQSNLKGDWKSLAWQSLLQGTRTLQGDYWNSIQSIEWKNAQWGMSLQHSLGWSASPIWMPVYKRVPSGTGDVAYDSLTQTFIEGVENGDYIMDGEEPVDSLPLRRTGNSRFASSLYLMPIVNGGFLRDLRFDVDGEWSADDSLSLPWQIWNEESLQDRVEGLWLVRYGVDWMLPDSLLGAQVHWDYRTEVSQGISRKEENVQGRIVDVESHITANWIARFQWKEENTQLRKPTEWSWKYTDWTPQLEWRLPKGWVTEAQLLYRTTDGLEIWQPNWEIRLDYQKRFEFALQYGQTRIVGDARAMPWYVTMGYAEGLTHRMEMDITWRIDDRLDLNFRWLWREQHSMVGSAKAYF